MTLVGVYSSPLVAGGGGDGFYDIGQVDALIASVRAETEAYLASKTEEMKWQGLNNVSFAAKEGREVDEIIAMARETPDILIAMCTHFRRVALGGRQRSPKPWCAILLSRYWRFGPSSRAAIVSVFTPEVVRHHDEKNSRAPGRLEAGRTDNPTLAC